MLVGSTFGQITPATLALVGLGKREEPAAQQRFIGKAIRQLNKARAQSVGVLCHGTTVRHETIVHAAEEASYHFDTYSPDPKSTPPSLSQLVVFSPSRANWPLRPAILVSQSVRYCRDLANQPPNLCTPSTLAAEARKLARRRGLRCRLWDSNQLKRDGFGGILAVGQGSATPPWFIRLDYRGGRANQPPYVVVGKAITFDTGGISIKPGDKMDEMKFDKCGGVAVLGILDAVAALRLRINVTGLISAAENMPSATAYRPGDLIKTLSGKYIEVLNTDAEGRVVLADALTYAQRLKPRAIVDLATLTGACVICFGHECAALLSNHDPLSEELQAASKRTGERVWPLPLWPEFQEKVKSDIASVKNTAGREGGAITGACFLNAFVEAEVSWAHLDIAGVAWTTKDDPHRAKGATAFGVRLVTDWLQSRTS